MFLRMYVAGPSTVTPERLRSIALPAAAEQLKTAPPDFLIATLTRRLISRFRSCKFIEDALSDFHVQRVFNTAKKMTFTAVKHQT